MKNPKDILTEAGYLQYIAHLVNMENAITFLLNHQDDLMIENEDLETLYSMEGTLQTLHSTEASLQELKGDD